MKKVTDQLTDEGVKLFAEAFDKLLAAVEKASRESSQGRRREELYVSACRLISRRP